MPTSVFIADTASPPSSLTILAKSEILALFGESLIIIGLEDAFFVSRVIIATDAGLFPNSSPPSFTLGHGCRRVQRALT